MSFIVVIFCVTYVAAFILHALAVYVKHILRFDLFYFELSSFFFFWRSRGPQAQADFFFLAEPSAKRNYFLSLAGWLNKKGPISGYVKHFRYKTPQISGVFQRKCLTYPEIRPFLFSLPASERK